MENIDLTKMRREMAAGDAKRDAGLTEPTDLIKITNIPYGPHGRDNLLDLYYPTQTTAPLPVIVSIHGGGFFYGDKELYRFYTMRLAQLGFVVVNFNYRLAPTHSYPAPLEDTNAVLNWLVSQQTAYPLDLERLFIVGDSAGGQLAEQYATLMSNPDYQALFDFETPPLSLKGLGLNCGAYFLGQERTLSMEFPFYFGTDPTPTTLAQFPVEAFITADFPPAFVTTATDDFLKDRAEPLVDLIQARGGQAELHLYAEPSGAPLYHVFHVNQTLAIAERCNQEQTAFFHSLSLN